MSAPFTYVLIAALALAATSMISRFVVWLPSKARAAWLPWLQAAAVGLLVGDSLLHVLSHALESSDPQDALLAACVGAGFLVAIETMVRAPGRAVGTTASFAQMNLVGDFIHHLIDGLILAGAFEAGTTAGFLALVAIAIHEIPREMGSAGVLVAAGYEPRKAFFLSVGMAAAVPVGASLVRLLAPSSHASAMVSAFAAGTILYVALADILPAVWERSRGAARLSPVLGVAGGLLFMFVLAHGEHH